MKKIYTCLQIIVFFPFIFSCKPNLELPEPNAGEADFSSTVAIGGNYLAGYQDGALYDKGQKNSIPSLLSDRFQLMKGSDCRAPMMPDDKGIGVNSKPWESAFVTKSTLGYKTDCKGVESLSPLKDLFGENAASAYFNHASGETRNLAVPFFTIKDFFNPSLGNNYGPANKNPYYSRFATQRGTSTVVSDMMKLEPTFAIVWLGMEDIFEYARAGGYGKTIMSAADFSLYLDSIVKPLADRGAKGVIANIPELKSFPFYSLIPWDKAELDQVTADTLNYIYNLGGLSHIQFVVGNNGFVIEDPKAPKGLRLTNKYEKILLTVPIDSMKCHNYGLLFNVIHDRYVLDIEEVDLVNKTILAYNSVILEKASKYNFAHVDMYSYFRKIYNGIRADGVDYNASFISGGFFSLDGYHPNQKACEMISNEFVKAINDKYNAVVPRVTCLDCEGIRFP